MRKRTHIRTTGATPRWRSTWLTFIALMAVIVIGAVAAFGLVPAESPFHLSLGAEWLTGFTGHTDTLGGALLANAAAASTKTKTKPETRAEGDGDEEVTMSRADLDAIMERISGSGEPTRAEIDAAIESLQSRRSAPPVIVAPSQRASAEGENPDAPQTRFTEADREREVDFLQHRAAAITQSTERIIHQAPRDLVELTEDLLRSLMNQDLPRARQVQESIFNRGGYAGAVPETRDGFQTLTEVDGGIFLPTMISNIVFDIEQLYGVVPQYAMQLPIPEGREKIPRVTGQLQFFAIAEGSEMKARKFAFGGITLDPHQWGVIVPWTVKMEKKSGNRLMPIVMRKVAQASAQIKDAAFINADGTSAYHNITGLLARAAAGDVAYHTALATHTSFAAMDADDWLDAQTVLPPSIRKRGVYVAHPDREYELRKLKDDQGQYIYGGPAANQDGVPRLWGRPVAYTEEGPNTDGTSAPAALYFDPEFLAYGVGDGLVADRLTEATIRDVDDTTLIRLGAQNMAALRLVEEFDLEFGDNTAFAVIRTAAM